MKYKTTEQQPPIFCSQEAILKLNEAGISTSGWIEHLRWIVIKNGFNLPSEDNESFGFILHGSKSKKTYTRIFIHYVDALAEELLLLQDEGMINKQLKIKYYD